MRRFLLVGCLFVIVPILLCFGRVSRVYSQSVATPFPTPMLHAWDEHELLHSSDSLQPDRRMTGTNCEFAPEYEPKQRWWGITWETFVNDNFEIMYRDWCGDNIQLTNNTSSDFLPNLNPLGTHIVFSSKRDGNYELYTMATDGSQLQRVTDNPLNDVSPDWSANNRIVFAQGSNTVDSEIWVMNPDGSGLQQLTFNSEYDEFPTWTADGKQIVWVRMAADGKSGELWRMNFEGSNGTRITNSIPYLSSPRVSPDDTRIMVTGDLNGDGPTDLIIMNSDGSNMQTLRASDFDPNTRPALVHEFATGGWFPDNSALLYNAYQYRQGNNGYEFYESDIDYYAPSTGAWVGRYIAASLYDFSPDIAIRDPFPPAMQLQPLPQYSTVPNVELTWQGKDTGISGLWSIELQYRTEKMDSWQAIPGFEPGSTDLSPHITFQSDEAGKVSFRMRAIDDARNVEPYPANDAAEVSTTLIAGWQQGRIADNRGVPYGLKAVDIQPSGVVTGLTTTNGEFVLPVFNFDPFTINDRWHIKTETPLSDLYVMPDDSVVRDGGFAVQSLSDWQIFRAQAVRLDPVVGELSLGLSKICIEGPCMERSGIVTSGIVTSGIVTSGIVTSGIMTSGIMTDGEVSTLPIIASASQSVTIPISMTKPTLSFLYRIRGSEPITSYFGITVDREITESVEISPTPTISNVLVSALVTTTITTTQVFSQGEKSDWALGWVDMSQWLGESITVTFAAHEGDGVGNMIVYLDEVSLGSWKTPIPQEVSPLKIDYGPAVTMTITGENFIGLPVVKLNGIVVSKVVKTDDTTLTVTIPKNFAPGVYFVQVINPEGQNAIAPQAVFVGKTVFLPLITR